MNPSQPPAPPDRNVPLIVAPLALRTIRVVPAHGHNYSKLPRRETRLVVLHCTDGHEGFKADDAVATMFASPNLQPPRSAHYVVDADSCTACVPRELTAWHCGKTGNATSIGVEICGRASQTMAQWFDPTSLATLRIAARVVADLCVYYKLPPQLIDAAGLLAGHRGITTHEAVGLAWQQTHHTDPGRGFPLDAFVAAVAVAMGQGASTIV